MVSSEMITVKGIETQLDGMIDTVSSTLSKSRAGIANNMGSQIASKASSGKLKYTPIVDSKQITADMNKKSGKWGRRILRMKHVLAIQVLKHKGVKVTWPLVVAEAKRIVAMRRRSRGYLRAGWLWPAYTLGIHANKGGSNKFSADGDRYSRGFVRGGAGSFGNRLQSSKRFSAATPAKGNRPAVIENLAASRVASRKSPNYERGIFSNGNPSRFKALGDKGLARAIKNQISFEKRSLPRALEAQMRRKAKLARKIKSFT